MNIEELQKSEVYKEVLVTALKEDLEKEYKNKLLEISKTIKIEGYRPGKVPLPLIERKYGKSLYAEFIEEKIKSLASKVMKDDQIFSDPEFKELKSEKGKDLSFKISYELTPNIKDIDLKLAKVVKPVLKSITDEDISNIKNQILENNENLIEITDTGVHKSSQNSLKEQKAVDDENTDQDSQPSTKATTHDIVDIDLCLKDEKESKLTSQNAKLRIRLGLYENKLLEDLEDKLIAQEVGKTVTLQKTLDEEFIKTFFKKDLEKIVNKEAILSAKIERIFRKRKESIDENLSQKYLGCSLADVDKTIEGIINRSFAENSLTLSKVNLFDYLDKILDFEIPKSIFDREVETLKENLSRYKDLEQEAPEIMDEVSDEDIDKRARRYAMRRIRIGLFLSKHAKKNNINVSQSELEEKINSIIRSMPRVTKEIIDFYTKDKRGIGMVVNDLIQEKSSANIIEKHACTEERKFSIRELENEIASIPAKFFELSQ